MGSRAKPVNEAYERGWSEGWSACLSRIEELGLEQVLERERDIYNRHRFPMPLTLCFDSAPAAIEAPEPVQPERAGEPLLPEPLTLDTFERGGDSGTKFRPGV